MDSSRVLAEYTTQVRHRAMEGESGRLIELGNGHRLARTQLGEDGPVMIVYSDLDGAGDAELDEVISAQLGAAEGRGFEWKYYDYDRPRALPDRLAAAGLQPGADEALLFGEIEEILTAIGRMGRIDGIEVLAVEDAELVDRCIGVSERAFGNEQPWMRPLLLGALSDPNQLAFVVTVDGADASAARLSIVAGTEFAGLWGGGTLESLRGRGAYRALVAHRARLAADRGCRYLQVDAAPTSEPILARLGFQRVATTIPFTREA